MDIQKIRHGNLIKIIPRENEEGLLSVQEIHKGTIIGEMLAPRQGYHFRIKFEEMIGIALTAEWLEKCGFTNDPENADIWRDKNKRMDFHFSELGQKQFYENGSLIGKYPVEYLHDFQNGYLFLTGKNLAISLE